MDQNNYKIHCLYDALVPVSELKPHPKNKNNHPDDQIKRLSKILDYQGWRYPIKVSKQSGFITSGHGRLSAALLKGWKEVPVNFQDYENDDQEFADVISDNSIASWSELDFKGINLEIPNLGPDFDIDLLGLKDFTIDFGISDKEEDSIPEPPKVPVSKLGDIYLLGNHRLMCGDSTLIDEVDKLMDGQKADMCFTSPPYNLGTNAKLRGYNGDGKDSVYNENTDHKTEQEYLDFLNMFTTNALIVSDTVFVNIQCLAGNKLVIPEYWNMFKTKLVDIFCWDKEHAQPSAARRVLNSVWEFIFIFSKEDNPTRSMKHGPDFRGTIDNIYRLNPVGKKDTLAKNHGAVFPVQMAEYFVSKFSDEKIYEPFGGSGSTLIACEKIKRRCFMMELDPHYIDVIVSRYCKFVGNNKVIRNGEEIDWAI